MPDGNSEETLIKAIKNKFLIETGKDIKIVICKEYESRANFTYNITIDEVILMVMDKMEWKFEDTYNASRVTERVYRRGLIDYIAIHNGELLINCAKATNRDHSTVINSVKKFEERLETEAYVRRAFTEIINYCRDNFYLYKGKRLLDNI